MKNFIFSFVLTISFISANAEGVSAVAYTNNGKYIITGGWDNMTRIWDATTKNLVSTTEKYNGYAIDCIAVSPDDKFMAVTGHNLYIVSIPDGQFIQELKEKGDYQTYNWTAYLPDGKSLVSVSNDGTIKIWDVETGKITKKIKTKTEGDNMFALSSDGKLLAHAGYHSKYVKVFDVSSSDQIAKIKFTDEEYIDIASVVFSPDAKHIAVTGYRFNPVICNVETKAVEKTIDAFAYSGAVLFPDNKHMYICEVETAYLYDMEKSENAVTTISHGTGVYKEKIERNTINQMVLSADGKFLLTGGHDNTARVWDLSTNKEVSKITHTNQRIRSREEIEQEEVMKQINGDGTATTDSDKCDKCFGKGKTLCKVCKGSMNMYGKPCVVCEKTFGYVNCDYCVKGKKVK